MIRLKKITKKFIKSKKEIFALKSITVDFNDGNMYAIMGHSGSGKSTLLNIIGLLDKPTSGLLFLDDINLSNINDGLKNEIKLNKIGYVFQECYLCNNLTVYENIMLPLLINKNISTKIKKQIVMDLIKMIKLSNRSNHFPSELSGGERQRVAIARALVNNPQIILADEPTGNLDKENELFMFKLFKKLAKLGKCVIVISHNEEIKKYADKVLYMNNGILECDKDEK